jgi:hypothetical protein
MNGSDDKENNGVGGVGPREGASDNILGEWLGIPFAKLGFLQQIQ